MRIIFVLPSQGGGGGAHSIVQESLGLAKLGVKVSIASPTRVAAAFRAQYPELEASGVANPVYDSVDDLAVAFSEQQLAIATMALSVRTVVEAARLQKSKRLKLAYYIQDYEPLFYSPSTADWKTARDSFTMMSDALLFAKTDWLRFVVEKNHGLKVARVQASIDHDVYFPKVRPADGPIKILAMVRSKTARRAPRRTIRILEQVAFKIPQVEVVFFGSDPSHLAQLGIFPSESLTNLGVLSRQRVADALRGSALFLDLSDYQAFGRTGLEGMACGCVPVLPRFGGADEYARNGVNSYVVDTRSDEQIMSSIGQFVNGRPELRRDMRDAAIQTALNYSIAKAAYSEYRLFEAFVEGRS